MISRLEIKGKWKVPENEEWVNGTLTYDPINETRLELFGTFNKTFFDQSSKEVIIGKTTEGEITLLDNWFRGSKHISKNDTVLGKYEPQLIFIGHSFEKISQIKFNKVVFQVFNLFSWISKTGQIKDFKKYDAKNYKIEYHEIPPIDIPINGNLTCEISFDGPISFGEEKQELTLSEESYVTLSYTQQVSYSEILKDISTFISSITLFTYEQSFPTKIFFEDEHYLEKRGKTVKKKFIHFLFNNANFSAQAKKRRSGQFLIEYKDIKQDYPSIIKEWFVLYERMDSVILLLIKFFKNKYHFSSDQFIDNIRALENFHRITRNNKRIPDEHYEALIKEILLQIKLPQDDLEWLKNRLIGNEPNLNIRLNQLIQENQNKFFIEKLSEIKKFSRKAVDARNYYTHYDKRLLKRVPIGNEFFKINQITRALLIACIVKELGVELEQLENGLFYHLG